ncbi:MAG: type II secretion system F family protein, partial [Ilumatobacteraceae bacterium]
ATASIRLAIERGRPVADAVASVDPTCRGNRHLATACSVIAVSATVGGASAAPLDRAAAALRLRAVDDEERRAHSAQARLSAHVLTVIPVGMLVLLVTTDPDVRGVVGEPAGAACVAIGLLLNATGWLWMRHTIGHRP